MQKSFAITSASPSVTLDTKGQADPSFSVTNSSAKALQGEARVMPLRDAKAEWFSITGAKQRDFPANGNHQITVHVAPTAGAQPGKYSFRLNLVDVRNPDEDFTEGPEVAFEIKTATPAPAPGGKFPLWILFVILGVVVVAAVVTVILILPKKVSVPNVTQKSFVDASNLLVTANLTVIREEEVTHSNVVGVVFAQTPTNSQQVKKGTAVTVTVEGQSKAVAVPDVIGVPASKVKSNFDSVGLKYVTGRETITPAPKRLPEVGTITATVPPVNSLVDVGSTVTLTVEGPSVTVPDVSKKLTIVNAGTLLQRANLVAQLEQRPTSDPSGVDHVIDQSPAAGTRVKPESKVAIYVGMRQVISVPAWNLYVRTNLPIRAPGRVLIK
jgi:beta-lactam-binding protein with PASTA domain